MFCHLTSCWELFSRARRNAVNAKIEDATAWIEDFLSESDPTEKLVVVGWSVEPLESLHRRFKKHSVIVNGKIDARRSGSVAIPLQSILTSVFYLET